MNKPIVCTTNLGRRFGQLVALGAVSLAIEPGTLAALVGPNGAGKTTLLGLIMGLLEPSEGVAKVFGEPARGPSAPTVHRIACVSDRHEPPDYVRLSGLIALQADASPGFDRPQMQRLLLDAGLAEIARYGTLSKGQRRWVLAALALASGADLLLLDEPAEGLDPAARRSLYDHLRDAVTRRGATVLVSSHVLTDVERVADDVVVLVAGRVRMHDSLETLRDEVREVQLPASVGEPCWPDGVRVLARLSEPAATKVWLRFPGGARPAESFGHVSADMLHTVNLESLYTAIVAESESLDESNATDHAEVPSCG